jgi:hypothetical protein
MLLLEHQHIFLSATTFMNLRHARKMCHSLLLQIRHTLDAGIMNIVMLDMLLLPPTFFP